MSDNIRSYAVHIDTPGRSGHADRVFRFQGNAIEVDANTLMIMRDGLIVSVFPLARVVCLAAYEEDEPMAFVPPWQVGRRVQVDAKTDEKESA